MKTILAVTAALIGMLITVPEASARFQVRCFSSHVATVDPIVSPGETSAHQHEFFGNRSTDKDSTYRSMRLGSTNCSTSADTAGYWTPTVLRPGGGLVRGKSLLIYYRTTSQTVAFPRNLRVISDDFRVGPNPQNLIIQFPQCWDGVHRDSPDHRSHMTFKRGGGCPASHPVEVPFVTEVFRYPVNVSGLTLSSGPLSTGHADFWNTWDQAQLVRLVARCADIDCGRIDDREAA